MPTVSVREHRFDVDAVVFDKDGTLLDLDASWAPIAAAWVAGIAPEGGDVAALICDALGLDAATGRLRPDSTFAMLPLVEIANATRLLLDAEGWAVDRIEHAIERAVAAVDGLTHDKHMDTLVDVQALFTHLRAGGLRLAVFTSDEPEPTTLFLDTFALHDHVDVVITAADVAEAKPSPEGLIVIAGALGVKPSRLMMVGDSIADRDSALAAGSVFVSVGHTTRAAVGAHTSVTTVAEIEAREEPDR
jgi:phosphoglycolate phosphatase